MKNAIIYPRSPRELMAGWAHLPRFIDKIRLHLAGKLDSQYRENFGTTGFDKLWLDAAGLTLEQFVGVVRETVCDGEVCDWVSKNVVKSEVDKAQFREELFRRGTQSDEAKARLRLRKKESGFEQREDIQTFVDYIDADEGRK